MQLQLLGSDEVFADLSRDIDIFTDLETFRMEIDVASDGQRFLVPAALERVAAQPLKVIVNLTPPFMEEHMKSLSDLAARYDEWAEANQASAEDLLRFSDSSAREIQEHQRWRASWLMASAAELRVRAAELRKIEYRRSTNNSGLSQLHLLTLHK